MKNKEVIAFLEKLESYLKEQQSPSRVLDTVEEVMELFKNNAGEEQKNAGLERIRRLFASMEPDHKPTAEDDDSHGTEGILLEKIRKELEKCYKNCEICADSMATVQQSTIKIFEQEFRQTGFIQAQGGKTSDSSHYTNLLMEPYGNLNRSLQGQAKKLADTVTEEYEHAMERVMAWVKPQNSYYSNIFDNYSNFQKAVETKQHSFQAARDQFQSFASSQGLALQRISQRHRLLTFLIQLIPILLLTAKIIYDQYFTESGSFSLLQLIVGKNLTEDLELILMLIKILPILLIYFIYLKFIKKVRNRSYIVKAQAYIQPRLEEFLNHLNLELLIREAFRKYIKEVHQLYMNQYLPLFQSLKTGGEAESSGCREADTYTELKKAFLKIQGGR